MLAWAKTFMDELDRIKQCVSVSADIDIFISREGQGVQEKHPDEKSTMVVGARPNAPEVLEQEFGYASEHDLRTVGVYVCGPQSLARDVSNKVSASQFGIIRGAYGSIREIFMEKETFGW